MKYRRIVAAVAFVTVGHLIVLSLWIDLFLPGSPPGTEGFQVMFLVCLYGSVLGIAMIVAGRSPRAERRIERRIERDGLEGWATIRAATPLGKPTGDAQITALELDLTVPGSESYSGRVVYEVRRSDLPRFAPGEILTVFVDPEDRSHIMLMP